MNDGIDFSALGNGFAVEIEQEAARMCQSEVVVPADNAYVQLADSGGTAVGHTDHSALPDSVQASVALMPGLSQACSLTMLDVAVAWRDAMLAVACSALLFACVLARTLAWLEEILIFSVWFQ